MLHVFILLEFCIHLCSTCSPLSLSTICTVNQSHNLPITLQQILHNQHKTTEGSVAGPAPIYSFSAIRAPRATDISHYTASVSSMPRCFMAKKLKYPYQQWKETKIEEDQDRITPVSTKSSPGSHAPLLSA